MADFKLTYFNVCGRAELTRLIFAKSGTAFEDDRIEFADWPAIKGKEESLSRMTGSNSPIGRRKRERKTVAKALVTLPAGPYDPLLVF